MPGADLGASPPPGKHGEARGGRQEGLEGVAPLRSRGVEWASTPASRVGDRELGSDEGDWSSMEKLAYLLLKEPSERGAAYTEGLLEKAAPALLAQKDVRGLTIELPDLADDPRVTPAHLTGRGSEIGGAVFVWVDSLDRRFVIEEILGEIGSGLAGYLVTESVVQPYARRDWSDGSRSPGVTQFVCFAQPDDLSDADFFARWHDRISPLSFELHPTRTRYVRNVVARTLTPDAPPWRGIVVERWGSLEEWLDPKQLYSSQALFDEMQAVGFAAPDSVSLTLSSEWILKSWDR
jgi:hypothetical protein